MNKVITINLNGNAYQLEEAGFEALRAYLDNAARDLADNPDKDEVIADIEQAIADKCRAVLSNYRNVVTTKEVERIIEEMGPVDTGKDPAATDGTKDTAGASTIPPSGDAAASGVRRLYRVREGAMLGGVCSGLGAYFAIDPAIVRIVFVLLAFVTLGGAAIAYLVLALVLPTAETAAEKAAAYGTPSTAQEFVRRAREGYYNATRTFGDKQAHREWKRRFKQEMRAWRYNFHREVHARAGDWRQNWYGPGVPPGQPPPTGFWIALPFIALFRAVAFVVLILAIVSLLGSGLLFGVVLPVGLPVWAAVLLLILFYKLLVWPVRAVRRSLFHPWSGAPFAPAMIGLWDALVGICVMVFIVWFVGRHVPLVHDAIMNFVPTVRHAIESFRDWLAQK